VCIYWYREVTYLLELEFSELSSLVHDDLAVAKKLSFWNSIWYLLFFGCTNKGYYYLLYDAGYYSTRLGWKSESCARGVVQTIPVGFFTMNYR
jgi:hypothetical protein